MRPSIHDLVAVAAILGGAAVGTAAHRLLSPEPARAPSVAASPGAPTAIRVVGVLPSGVGRVSRAGAPDLPVTAGTVIPVDGRDFVASFRVPRHLGPITVQVEFLRGDEVVGSGSVSSLRPKVFVEPHRFGVRGI